MIFRGAILLVILASGLVITGASAADITLSAFVGDTIHLQGYSYVGQQVYLYLTGPGLPASGVTLERLNVLGAQNYTAVDLDNSQQWTYDWDTSKIRPPLESGAYFIYVTTQPTDITQLPLNGNSYKTIEVDLQNSNQDQVTINANPGFTLNPEQHTSTISPTQTTATPAPTPTQTTLPPPTTTPTAPPATQNPAPTTTKAAAEPWIGIIALVSLAGILHSLRRSR
jgi:hypothetical protein